MLLIKCHHCHTEFDSDHAKFCKGKHRPTFLGWQSLRDRGVRTLKCPHCGRCACRKVVQWEAEGQLVDCTDGKFTFRHVDTIVVEKGKGE